MVAVWPLDLKLLRPLTNAALRTRSVKAIARKEGKTHVMTAQVSAEKKAAIMAKKPERKLPILVQSASTPANREKTAKTR